MALPKINNLSSEFEVRKPDEDKKIKLEIEKLGKSIQESSSLGLKAATQSVIGNVPAMIKEITDELKSGPVDNFAIAINKLVKLTNELGIDLREYNKDLADTVDRFNNRLFIKWI